MTGFPLQQWLVINPDNAVIKILTTRIGGRNAAVGKLRFQFPNTYFCLRLKPGRIIRMGAPHAKRGPAHNEKEVNA